MTWKELSANIGQMTDEQKGTDVTAYDAIGEEFYPVETLEFANMNTMVLDENHPFLIF